MHEVSIVKEISDIVILTAEKNNIKKVTKVLLEVGEFSCIQDEHLKFAFEIISKNTLHEGSLLEIKRVGPSSYCSNCKINYPITFVEKLCPSCKQINENIQSGYDTLVKAIEGD